MCINIFHNICYKHSINLGLWVQWSERRQLLVKSIIYGQLNWDVMSLRKDELWESHPWHRILHKNNASESLIPIAPFMRSATPVRISLRARIQSVSQSTISRHDSLLLWWITHVHALCKPDNSIWAFNYRPLNARPTLRAIRLHPYY